MNSVLYHVEAMHLWRACGDKTRYPYKPDVNNIVLGPISDVPVETQLQLFTINLLLAA